MQPASEINWFPRKSFRSRWGWLMEGQELGIVRLRELDFEPAVIIGRGAGDLVKE